MRVAHILRKYDPAEWGGTESAIHLLANGLQAHGIASSVFAPSLAGDAAGPDPFASSGGRLHRFKAIVPVWRLSNEERRHLVAVGGNIISLDLLGALWREPGVGVVHSHALGRLGAIAQTVARSRRCPFVLSVHGGVYDLPPSVKTDLGQLGARGWDWGKPLGFALRARHLLSTADAIVTYNPREAGLIRERHPDQRVIVQPHGVPTAEFSGDHRPAARQAFPGIEGREVLLIPGRIDPVKNQDWIVSQAPELVRRHRSALLIFVGPITNQSYAATLRASISRAGLEGHVLLAGRLPPQDSRLIGLMQEARAVVLPSKSETFGLVILEAWAAGTPAISSRTSGATALIRKGQDGLLFDLDRPEDFHAAVDLVLTDPSRRDALGAAGRARAIGEFDVVALARRMGDLYGSLTEKKHALRHSA